MKITIIGTGYVGLVSGACFSEIGHEVLCVDNDIKKVKMLRENKIPIYEPGLEELVKKNVAAGRLSFSNSIEEGTHFSSAIFIAVSTPPRPDGGADLSSVEKVAKDVAKYMKDYKVVVDKSTVPVRTGEKVAETITRYGDKKIPFDVVSNPEFLREGSAIKDFLEPDRIVIGVSSEKAAALMKEIYAPLKDKPVIVTDIKSAEIIKHASNSFLALKISFINSVSHICDLAGADIKQVALGMGLDRRIGRQFLEASLGYGGSCFPKDVSAFIKIGEQMGYSYELLKAVEKVNRDQQEYFFKKIEQSLWVLNGKKIAIWGLAFKANTDDMRMSPILPIIHKLQAEGTKIIAYDPEAMEKAKEIVPDIEYGKDPYSILEGCDGLIIATDWDVFRKADLKKAKELLLQPIIIDGRNLFENSLMQELGFDYASIGRPSVRHSHQ